MPELCFRLGQRVIERVGDTQETAQTCESEIIERNGRLVTTDCGNVYDALTGAAEPKGHIYRAIRGVTPDERKRATDLLGGTEARK